MSDMLKQAKQSLAISFGDYSQEINAQRAQAAALIAIAEQLRQIVDLLKESNADLYADEAEIDYIRTTEGL